MNDLRTWIEINQDHLNRNISQYKGVIGNRNLSIVIKANAYGHGIAQIAQFAQSNTNVHSFCVATLKEALLVRNAGTTKPILVTSILDGDPACAINKNIALTVYDLESAHYLQSIGTQHNAFFPVHIKIDTGLSRLGILPQDAPKLIKTIQAMPNLFIQGIYSHCAESHKKEDDFTLKQQHLFKELVKKLQASGTQFPFVHFANSAATTSLDLEFCNLFRVGIGVFGLWPSQENKAITQKKYPWFDLKPILTWKTIIQSIKNVTKGSFIGYDRTFQAQHAMRIAILPIGYYDGYDFRLFNKSHVIINGIPAPIIGRISMNMSTVDVSHIPSAQVDDKVTIMGPYPYVHPYELGLLTGNPNVREMTTKINPDIPRITISNSQPQKKLSTDFIFPPAHPE